MDDIRKNNEEIKANNMIINQKIFKDTLIFNNKSQSGLQFQSGAQQEEQKKEEEEDSNEIKLQKEV